MQAIASVLMLIAIVKWAVTWDFDLFHPIHIAIGFLVITSDYMSRKYL